MIRTERGGCEEREGAQSLGRWWTGERRDEEDTFEEVWKEVGTGWVVQGGLEDVEERKNTREFPLPSAARTPERTMAAGVSMPTLHDHDHRHHRHHHREAPDQLLTPKICRERSKHFCFVLWQSGRTHRRHQRTNEATGHGDYNNAHVGRLAAPSIWEVDW